MENKKTNKREQWDEIEIAFDRRNNLYIAYSTETGIVASGICVPSAVAAYKAKYQEIQAELAAAEYAESKSTIV